MNETERRQFLKAALAGAGLTLASTATGQETTTTEGGETTTVAADEDDGLVTVSSDDDFEATVEHIRTSIEENENLSLVTTVDHAANAETVNMDLRPTTLLVFGNPAGGTPLMQASQSIGIDLPQKLLVWETEDGSVNVTYNDPTFLADRHGIEEMEDLLSNTASVLESLATGE
jgi:uncharacterized protein (DUF302 family)